MTYLITIDMFDASPSQPQQPSPSDDDAYAQPIQSSNSRDSSSDSSKEYLPQKYNREDDDAMSDEEARCGKANMFC
jgi:hypothetical protein